MEFIAKLVYSNQLIKSKSRCYMTWWMKILIRGVGNFVIAVISGHVYMKGMTDILKLRISWWMKVKDSFIVGEASSFIVKASSFIVGSPTC